MFDQQPDHLLFVWDGRGASDEDAHAWQVFQQNFARSHLFKDVQFQAIDSDTAWQALRGQLQAEGWREGLVGRDEWQRISWWGRDDQA